MAGFEQRRTRTRFQYRAVCDCGQASPWVTIHGADPTEDVTAGERWAVEHAHP